MGRQIDKAAKKIGDLKFWLHFSTWGSRHHMRNRRKNKKLSRRAQRRIDKLRKEDPDV